MSTPAEDESGDDAGPPSTGARLYDGLAYIGGALLAVMTAAVFVQVVLRYLGLTGIDGLEEVPRYLFVWLIMFGAAAAMWRNEHTALDYFVNRFSLPIRLKISIVTNGLGIGLFAYLIWLSFTLIPNAAFQTSPGLGLTLDWVFAAVPVGAAMIIVPMIRNIYFAARGLWQKPS